MISTSMNGLPTQRLGVQILIRVKVRIDVTLYECRIVHIIQNRLSSHKCYTILVTLSVSFSLLGCLGTLGNMVSKAIHEPLRMKLPHRRPLIEVEFRSRRLQCT